MPTHKFLTDEMSDTEKGCHWVIECLKLLKKRGITQFDTLDRDEPRWKNLTNDEGYTSNECLHSLDGALYYASRTLGNFPISYAAGMFDYDDTASHCGTPLVSETERMIACAFGYETSDDFFNQSIVFDLWNKHGSVMDDPRNIFYDSYETYVDENHMDRALEKYRVVNHDVIPIDVAMFRWQTMLRRVKKYDKETA